MKDEIDKFDFRTWERQVLACPTCSLKTKVWLFAVKTFSNGDGYCYPNASQIEEAMGGSYTNNNHRHKKQAAECGHVFVGQRLMRAGWSDNFQLILHQGDVGQHHGDGSEHHGDVGVHHGDVGVHHGDAISHTIKPTSKASSKASSKTAASQPASQASPKNGKGTSRQLLGCNPSTENSLNRDNPLRGVVPATLGSTPSDLNTDCVAVNIDDLYAEKRRLIEESKLRRRTA